MRYGNTQLVVSCPQVKVCLKFKLNPRGPVTSEAGLKSECPSSLQSSGICITELFILSTRGTLEQSTGISLAGASFWIVAAGSVGMLTQ